jgi:hypothetical protein
MVTGTSNTPGQSAEPMLFSATAGPASINSTDSFERQLESALATYLGQSGIRQELDLNIQLNQRQESGSGQNLVTSVTLPMADPSAPPAAPVAETPSSAPPLSEVLQGFANGWSTLTPQQVAFQLANASGSGGGDPSATVPGTTLTFGQLNQTQQLAYQYALNYGTGDRSMQAFLTQNTGPRAAWNLSWDQSQQTPAIQAAVDSSYQVAAGGVPMPIQAAANSGLPTASGNADNLPNPAMIQYLPPDQQAAAEAAVAAEGAYGDNIAAAAIAYAAT